MTQKSLYIIISVTGRCEKVLNNLNNDNIIIKSQMYEQTQPDKVLGDSFAKTINCTGIHNNFCLDIPEIIEEEKRQQERRDDIAKFTKLAVSDIENTSHNTLVEQLNIEDILSEYEQKLISELSHNRQLLNDLGL